MIKNNKKYKYMARQEQIIEAGIKYQISKHPMAIGGALFDDDIKELNRNHSFEAGAEWADNNLSDNALKKILNLLDKGMYLYSELDDSNYSEIFEYIKNYWNDSINN